MTPTPDAMRPLALLATLAACSTSCAPSARGGEPSPPGMEDAVGLAPTTTAALLVASSVSSPSGESLARIERVTFVDGHVVTETVEDPRSNVFHVVRCDPSAPEAFLSGAGNDARISRWARVDGAWRATDLYEARFSPRFSRVRDFELVDRARLGLGTGLGLAVATHDQGVITVIGLEGGDAATELDRTPFTFVHEIEVGDVDGDGTDEIYATTSPPQAVVGSEQRGQILRFVRGVREVIADLPDRHAKELLVEDLDGDGRDELYAVIEGRTERRSDEDVLLEPVEIRVLGAHDAWETVATLPDRLTRFLLATDLDGDGGRELVAATFSTGLWWIQRDAAGGWARRALEPDSGGFEHAITVADLDGDGRDELYEADDPAGVVRIVRWTGERFQREPLLSRPPGSAITWSLVACPSQGSSAPRTTSGRL